MKKIPLDSLVLNFPEKHKLGLSATNNIEVRIQLDIDITTIVYTNVVTKSVLSSVIEIRDRIGLKELDPINMIIMAHIVSRLVKLNYMFTIATINNPYIDLFQGWCNFVWMVITTELPEEYLNKHFHQFIESADNWERHLSSTA